MIWKHAMVCIYRSEKLYNITLRRRIYHKLKVKKISRNNEIYPRDEKAIREHIKKK